MDKTPERDLTLKQRKWLKLYLKYGNAKKAALEVYDCTEESAGQIGYENLNKLDYQDFLEEAGITDDLLQKKIIEGLDSTRTISAIKGTKADGGTTDFIDVPDFMARHKYLETALKLKKRLTDKLALTNADGQSLPITIVAGTGYIPPGVKVAQVSNGSGTESTTKV